MSLYITRTSLIVVADAFDLPAPVTDVPVIGNVLTETAYGPRRVRAAGALHQPEQPAIRFEGQVDVGPGRDGRSLVLALGAKQVIAAALSGTVNDWQPTDWEHASAVVLTSSGGNVTLTGAVPTPKAPVKFIIWDGPGNLTLVSESSGSVAPNRFGTTADVTVPAGTGLWMLSDAIGVRWRVRTTIVSPFTAFAADLFFGFDAANATLVDPGSSPMVASDLADASSNSNDLAGSGSTRPAGATSSTGYAQLVFDGSDVMTRTATIAGLQTGDGLYIWAIVSFNKIGSVEYLFSAENSSGLIAFGLSKDASDYASFTLRYSDAQPNEFAVGSTAMGAGKVHLLEGWLDTSASELNVALDGGAPVSASAGSATLTASGIPVELHLGQYNVSPGFGLDGLVRQVGAINRSPTAADRLAVLDYFQRVSNLPALSLDFSNKHSGMYLPAV